MAAMDVPDNSADTQVIACPIVTVPRFHVPPIIRLVTLKLHGLPTLESIPPSLACMSGTLKTLVVAKCAHINNLPCNMGEFRHLQKLVLSNCPRVKQLPDGVGSLPALEVFRLRNMKRLFCAVNDVFGLASLKELSFVGCPAMRWLPLGLERLPNLELVKFWDLKSLPGLPLVLKSPRLRKISFHDLPMLETFPHLSSANNLRAVYVVNCESLERLSVSVSCSSSLRTLTITDCKKLQAIPGDLSGCHKLRRLKLKGLPLMTELPSNLELLPDFQVLLEDMPSLSCLPAQLSMSPAPQTFDVPPLRPVEDVATASAAAEGAEGDKETDVTSCVQQVDDPDVATHGAKADVSLGSAADAVTDEAGVCVGAAAAGSQGHNDAAAVRAAFELQNAGKPLSREDRIRLYEEMGIGVTRRPYKKLTTIPGESPHQRLRRIERKRAALRMSAEPRQMAVRRKITPPQKSSTMARLWSTWKKLISKFPYGQKKANQNPPSPVNEKVTPRSEKKTPCWPGRKVAPVI